MKLTQAPSGEVQTNSSTSKTNLYLTMLLTLRAEHTPLKFTNCMGLLALLKLSAARDSNHVRKLTELLCCMPAGSCHRNGVSNLIVSLGKP